MAPMTQRIAFILGRGAAVSVATPALPTSTSVVTAPTTSARSSATQPKRKPPRPIAPDPSR
jgi:hypothetical protein